MGIKERLTKELENSYKKLGFDPALAVVSFSSRPEICDFQNNGAFQIAKEKHQNPLEIAKQIVNATKIEGFDIAVCAPAFINISIKENTINELAKELTESKQIVEQTKKPLSILIDYGGANVAKELHMGHLRSPLIGESLKRLYKTLGHSVVSDTHLGDWGMQMGLTIAQMEEDGILDYWFKNNKIGKMPIITLDMMNEEYPKASKRKELDKKFKKKADDYTLFVQQKKEPYFEIYKLLRKISVTKIEKNYSDLNCEFDLWLGESDAAPYIEKTIQLFIDKGLARKSEGALVVDVAREGEQIPIQKKNPNDASEKQMYKNPMPPALIKKHNDGDLYATTDLATIMMRNKMCKYDEIHYVVDKRQGLHFEQVFRCAKLAGISPKDQNLVHIGFGTMNGPDGKPFKTREGTTVKLDDVVHLLQSTASDKLEQNDIIGNNKLSLQIGVAAMKFGDLSNIVSKDYVFDLDKFLQFEGKTGPYLQYTATRIKSLISKAGEYKHVYELRTKEERTIIINILQLLTCLNQCFEEKSLNSLCLQTYNLCSTYSNLYTNIRILNEKDVTRKNTLLTISELTLKVLSIALNILAIDIPDRM